MGPTLNAFFAVNVHCGATAKRRFGRAGSDRRPPAIFNGVFPQLVNRQAWFSTDDTCFRIPIKDAIEATQVEDDAVAVVGGVAIRVAAAPQPDAEVGFMGDGKDFGELIGVNRPKTQPMPLLAPPQAGTSSDGHQSA